MNLTARYRIVYHSNVPTNRRCPDDVAASLLSVTLSPLCPQTLSPSHYLPGLCTLVLAPLPLWLARTGTFSLRKDFHVVKKFPDRPTASDRAVFSFTLFLVLAFLSFLYFVFPLEFCQRLPSFRLKCFHRYDSTDDVSVPAQWNHR